MQLYRNETICTNLKLYPDKEDHTQGMSSHIIAWHRFFFDCPTLLVLPFCGAWIDQIGRKFAVIVPCLGTILAIVCYLLSMINSATFLPFLLLGSFLKSISGGTPLIVTGVLSYVAEISSEASRTSRVGITFSMNLFGNVIGYAFLGVLFTLSGFKTVFCVVMILACFCLLGGVFLFQDVKSSKKEENKSSLFNVNHLKDSLKVVYRKRPNGNRWKLLSLLSILIINQICREGERDVVILYVTRRPLNWSKSLIGYLMTAEFTCMGLCTSLLLPFLTYKLMWHDLGIAMFGIVSKMIRVLLLALTHTTILVFISTIIGTPIAMAVSSVTSQISKTVDQDEIGKVLAMVQFAQVSCSLIGSIGYPEIYSAVASFFPGLPFLINSLLYVVALVILGILACKHDDTPQYEQLNAKTPDTLDMLSEAPKAPKTIDNSENTDTVDSPKVHDPLDKKSENHLVK